MFEEAVPELLTLFKALADVNRLKIVGLLASKPHTAERLGEILGLRPPTVSRHLARLARAGVISVQQDRHGQVCRLEGKNLEAKAQRLLTRESFPAIALNSHVDAFDAKVVRDFSTPDGRLKAIPSQRKKLKAVLRHIVAAFEPGARYSEREVNRILEPFNDDTSSLRRALVDYGFMDRDIDGAAYWRIHE
ncbi:MAG TPA: metalloregulator ArsR/SmtB family transcription factor [Vicinamibacterales bacterium]|nr:metalloregulator ArsR/SmtB family transcription factor [Vicinamibacterales bacterium]